MGTFGTGIKSVQRGVLTLATNPEEVTITAVVVDKSFLIINESESLVTGQGKQTKAVLTSTTKITFSQTATSANLVAWQVVEFY